jgi:hypothetical protein
MRDEPARRARASALAELRPTSARPEALGAARKRQPHCYLQLPIQCVELTRGLGLHGDKPQSHVVDTPLAVMVPEARFASSRDVLQETLVV